MQCQPQPLCEELLQKTPAFPFAMEDPLVCTMARERERALELLMRNAPLHGAIQGKLGKVILSAVHTPGGLFRFHLTQQVAQAFAASTTQAESMACAVEYFHIASLLLDDLPQMDDSLERRGRICPHLLHGEDMVMLGALGFITRAYGLLGRVICSGPMERASEAHTQVEECLGTLGMLNGQARDLSFSQAEGGHREAVSVALGKTVPLIQMSLSLPAQLFGADRRTLASLRRLSIFWGLIYQGADDFKDLLEKTAVSGKTAGRDAELGRPNIALLDGEKTATKYLERLDRLAEQCIASAEKNHPPLAFLSSFQKLLRARWQSLVS